MEELLKFFEFKPGLEFFNSPLFVLIIIIIIGAYIGIHFLRKHLRKRREKAPKKIKPSAKETKQQLSTKDVAHGIISELPGYKKEPEKIVAMEPVEPSEIELKNIIKEAVKEAMIEGQVIKKTIEPDLATQTAKKETKIDISEVRAEIDRVIEQKVSKTLDKRIEEKVDETLKKNKKISFWKRLRLKKMPTQKREEIIFSLHQQGNSTEDIYNATGYDRQFINQTVQQKAEKPKDEPESKRHRVKKLCDEGRTEEEIYDITGFDKKLISRYREEWENSLVFEIKQRLPTINWKTLNKLMEIMGTGQPIIVEGNKLYYPGRDRLTYVFIGTTLVELIAIVLLL